MGEYNVNYDYYRVVSALKKSLIYYPLELQLIWLLEINLIDAYMKSRNKCVINNKGNHVFYFRDLTRFTTKFNGLYTDTIKLLIRFRNKYVHEGCVAAKPYFDKLVYENKEKVCQLAEEFKVRLNVNITLYDTFGAIE